MAKADTEDAANQMWSEWTLLMTRCWGEVAAIDGRYVATLSGRIISRYAGLT